MPILPYIALGAQVVGTLLEAEGVEQESQTIRAQSRMRRKSAEFKAKQLEVRAKETIAAQQRVAAEERRQSELAQSRILALAAASGASASDATVENLIARTAGEGAYRSMIALYEGESEARMLRWQGKAAKAEAGIESDLLKRRAEATELAGVASILETGASLLGKYGKLGGTEE